MMTRPRRSYAQTVRTGCLGQRKENPRKDIPRCTASRSLHLPPAARDPAEQLPPKTRSRGGYRTSSATRWYHTPLKPRDWVGRSVS